MNALARLTGRTYDQCWLFLTGRVETLLAIEQFWAAVSAGAQIIMSSGEISGCDFERATRPLLVSPHIPSIGDLWAQLKAFVDTPQIRAFEAGVIRSLGSVDDGFAG